MSVLTHRGICGVYNPGGIFTLPTDIETSAAVLPLPPVLFRHAAQEV
jgi:hypothetical protein